jgi:hypothetical protein
MMLYTGILLNRSLGPTGLLLVTAGICTVMAHLLLFNQVSTSITIMVALAIVVLATAIMASVGEIRNIASRWGNDPVPSFGSMFVVEQHHMDPTRKVWRPKGLSVDTVRRHALGTVGITSLLRSLHDSFTWVLEYKLQALLRVLLVDWKVGRYAREHTHTGAYECIMNTSLACFLDRTTGNVILFDTQLSYGTTNNGTTSSKLFHKITFGLDHEARACGLVCLEEHGEQSKTTTLTGAEEIGTVVLMAIALKTHVNVHYFANGVSSPSLTNVWPLAGTSSELTQALNRAAVFVAPFFMANRVYEVDHHAEAVGSNMIVEGLPFHSHLGQWTRNTSMHKILAKARQLLMKVPAMKDAVNSRDRHLFVETILAATILHAADHYYIDKYLGYQSRCEFLQVDMTLLRTALTPPNRYRTRRFLCREYPDDAICQALHLAAHEVDPEFADTALFVGIAN